MEWTDFLVGLFSIFAILLFFFYWFIPLEKMDFGVDKNPEFSVGNISNEMQFYKNMRFENPDISYKIDSGCSLKKKQDMERAFDSLGELTILDFYPVTSGEEIMVSCDDEVRPSGNNLFIAGEGGPTKILSGENFYIIYEGKILLLRESNCEHPNVGIHELLHVLGFDHSENKNNILYPVSSCSQTIGNEIIEKIDEIYSFPSLPDMKLGNVSSSAQGRYLDLNFSIKNIGISSSSGGKVVIYGDERIIKEFEFDEIKAGQGMNMELRNIWLPERTTEKIKIKIETLDNELSLENNELTLQKLNP
ncbi:MAG: matrixin family metalloprotease [Nanoarchaeota archaeon]|nr:matrixin family metalloprotease [Nanoarchaeota archaeon]